MRVNWRYSRNELSEKSGAVQSTALNRVRVLNEIRLGASPFKDSFEGLAVVG